MLTAITGSSCLKPEAVIDNPETETVEERSGCPARHGRGTEDDKEAEKHQQQRQISDIIQF